MRFQIIVSTLICNILFLGSSINYSYNNKYLLVNLWNKLFFTKTNKNSQDLQILKKHDLDLTEELFVQNVELDNEKAMDMLFRLVTTRKGWKHVSEDNGVIVERRLLDAGSYVSKEDALKGTKHVCVKSSAVINASTEVVFNLFADSKRAKEYNMHIKVNKDILNFPRYSNNQWTKCTWVSTPKYGIFKSRDFVTVTCYTKYDNGTSVILNRPAYLSNYPKNNKYVRATVLLGGNIIRPYGLYNNQTHLTMLAQVNPGGISDLKAASFFINKLCTKGPPTFMHNLQNVIKSDLNINKNINKFEFTPSLWLNQLYINNNKYLL